MSISKSLFLLPYIAMTLVACTPPSPQKREDAIASTATFYVESTKAASVRSRFSAVTSLPTARTLSFEACFRDNQLGKALENHLFRISDNTEGAGISLNSEAKDQNLRTDAGGCVHWSEEISFNYLAKSQWLQIDRVLTAQGFQSGQRVVSFAINPWDDKVATLLNQKIPNLLSVKDSLTALEASSSARMILEDLKVTINEVVVGKILNLELKTTPQLLLARGENRTTQETLTSGEFLMDLKLYALVGGLKKTQVEIGRVEKRPMKVRNGVFLNTEPIMIELKQLCQNGSVELEIHLTPQTPELGNLQFDGIFNNLGECDQLKGGFFAKLKYSPQLETPQTPTDKDLKAPLSTEDFIQNSLKNPELEKFAAPAQGQIFVSEISPRAIAYIGNSQDRERKKIFSITACLLRPLDKKPVANQKIKVTKVNGSQEEIETLLSGCLTWDDSLSFNQLESECWVRKSFSLENSSLQFRQSREIDINPFNDGPESVRDARRGQSELACGGPSTGTATGIKNQLLMQSYEFDMAAEGVHYQIDNYLNLKIVKNGILKIPIKLIKSSYKSVESRIEVPAPAGEYRLRWAIVDGSIKNFDLGAEKYSGLIYQIQEAKVQIEGSGTLSKTISIEQADTKTIGNLNTILFEISPTQSSEKFESITFSGSILVADRKEPGALEVLQRGSSLIEKLSPQFEKDLTKAREQFHKMATLEFAAQEKKARLVDLSQAPASQNILKDLSTPTFWKNPKDTSLAKASAYSAQKISQFISDGKIDNDFEDRFCALIFLNKLSQKYPQQSSIFSDFYRQCKKSISHQPWVKKDFLYFVKNPELLSSFEFTNEVRSLGNGFIMNYGKDYSEAFSVDVNGGFNTGKLIGKISEWISPLSVGGGARYQWAWSDRASQGNAIATQAVKQLLIEKLPFKLRAPEYEKCLMLRLGKLETSALQEKLAKELKSLQFVPDLYQPLLFCDRKIQQKEKVFREDYTIINQLTYGALATNLNSQNARSFFMLLRGNRDYLQLVEDLAESMVKPDSEKADFTLRHSIDAQFKPIFDSPTRSIPGVFIDSQ